MALTTFYFYHYGYWELRQKVTFDGPNKLIIINEEEDLIDIQVDVYSAWKNWAMYSDNLKFDAAMRAVGGDPLPGGDFLGSTFFLINDWKIYVDHSVGFSGNLFAEDGSSAFVAPTGTQIVTQRVSNLVDKVGSDLTNARVFV